MIDATALVRLLGLAPHPEGGFYREVYRSATTVASGGAPRSALTTIYFLLAAGQHSRWHVVDADEVWHFYDGEPLELLTYEPATGILARTVLGRAKAVADGEPEGDRRRPVHVVPAGVWQAAHPLGAFALVGCTVAPGFDFAGFRFVADLPEHRAPFAGVLAATAALL